MINRHINCVTVAVRWCTNPKRLLISAFAALLLTKAITTSAIAEESIPNRDNLITLVFPNAKPIAESGDLLIEVGSVRSPAPGSDATLGEMERIKPLGWISQDPSHIALITERTSADEQGMVRVSHPTQATIGAYIFVRRNGRWNLETRADNVAKAGFFGSVDGMTVVKLAPTINAIAILSSSCWQGYCGKWLTVIGLSTSHADLWADGIRLGADDIAAKPECGDTLNVDPTHISTSLQQDKAIPAESGEDTAVTDAQLLDQCYFIDGEFSFLNIGSQDPFNSNELVISFRDRIAPNPEVGRTELGSQDMSVVATYRLSGGRYQLVAGRNPVPDI